MTNQSYLDRRLVRTLENIWSRFELLINRFATTRAHGNTPREVWNPFYHLGTISIFLLAVLTITGTPLTILYRPGAPGAFESVNELSATWWGSLLRSIHRYAGDAMALTILLHAIKMFVSERFWGQRWLAWVSGWVLIFLLWTIGSSGYWLVWDERAQWLTEFGIALTQGSTALSFVTPEGVANLFAFFVLVLFVHVFFSLVIMLGLLIHLMRMARVQIWSPRWLMIQATIALIAISIWQPALSLPIADTTHLVGTITLNGWYLGFLPFAGQFGALFWIGIAVFGIALMALPWIARGKHPGPAVVTETFCSGCALCAKECPYNAIQMESRKDASRFQTIAVIKPSLCTGCGICVGTCASAGVELDQLRTAPILERVRAELKNTRAPIVMFACQRHLALGTLSTLMQGATTAQLEQGAFIRLKWSERDVITTVLPCAGMVMPEWIREFLDHGARAVVNVACPAHDCSYREGPQWLNERIKRHPALLTQNVFYFDASLGDQRALKTLLDQIARDAKPGVAQNQVAPNWIARTRASFAGTALLLIAFAGAMLIQIPGTASVAGQGMVRLALSHKGIVKHTTANAALQSRLPTGVSVEQVLGGERYPVQLRLQVDGGAEIHREFGAGGLGKDGTIYGVDALMLPAGKHQIELWMNDNGKDWRQVFSDALQVDAGRVRTLTFDATRFIFTAR
ncbi:MAG: hydrogenase iron-sulfur subunit [Chloroflexi bacterium]|nr:hydrogenase iron-sulfur subunit [Chloroflexota bacterium]